MALDLSTITVLDDDVPATALGAVIPQRRLFEDQPERSSWRLWLDRLRPASLRWPSLDIFRSPSMMADDNGEPIRYIDQNWC